jgi:DNA-binding MarR family transcriptional regulator
MIMTKREFITMAMGLEGATDEMRETGEKMLAALDKKSSKPTKAQVENEGIKAKIKAYIAENPGKRIGEIAEGVGYTPNKVNALVTQLRKAGEVERYEDKKVAYFRIAE